MTKTYTRQEADEILRRALAVQPADGISHEDLVAAAREVGIPSSAIEAAALELDEDRLVQARAQQIRRRRRVAFARHLLIYLVVNAGIFFVDRADGGAYWFQYPLIIWGVILAAIGIAQLAPDQRSLMKRAERELAKEERRAERRRRRGSRRDGSPARYGAQEFEAAVQEGVSTLLSVAARTIRGITAEGERFRVHDSEAPRASSRQRTAPSQRSGARESATEPDAAEPAATGPAAARSQRHGD